MLHFRPLADNGPAAWRSWGSAARRLGCHLRLNDALKFGLSLYTPISPNRLLHAGLFTLTVLFLDIMHSQSSADKERQSVADLYGIISIIPTVMPERHNKNPTKRSRKASNAIGLGNSEYSLRTANIKKEKQSVLIAPIEQLSQYRRINRLRTKTAAMAIAINSSAVGS